ncbi:YlxP-like protein [uncultured Rubrobacteraceae bacterium]|uniref:YlxP-like protein n=1 Tax=uncultured Rubrobacteraceae bacterium TaxID=349277 RepID=A0A6J4P3A7_9ACTN|nr:YlxP-like protein [uncultured Rubrobacteraceae bacterium]
MFCAVRLELELPFSSSLKDKRQTLRSLKDRLRRKNVSVVESGNQDLWQRATVEIALAAVSRGAAEEKREELRRTLLNYEELQVLDWREEFVKL